MDEDKKKVAVQKMKWTAVFTTDSYQEARNRADACKGKVKHRPSGKFEVRVGSPVHTETKEEPVAS